MGQALCEVSPRARAVFERADQALGFSISRLCFEGPDSELLLTKFAQPAILTTSIAALEALEEAQPSLPRPAFVLGHSLGEYSALVAAGALAFEDAVRVVHERGLAMQEAVPEGQGGMAAIMGGDSQAVIRLCEDAAQGEVLGPANFNAPGQVVIAGTRSAIERAVELSKSRSLKAIVLKVSAPFHSSLMAPARDRVDLRPGVLRPAGRRPWPRPLAAYDAPRRGRTRAQTTLPSRVGVAPHALARDSTIRSPRTVRAAPWPAAGRRGSR